MNEGMRTEDIRPVCETKAGLGMPDRLPHRQIGYGYAYGYGDGFCIHTLYPYAASKIHQNFNVI